MSTVATSQPENQFPASQPPPAKSRTGCILLGVGGGCLLILLICGGLIAAGTAGVFGLLKTSEPYVQSLEKATQNAEVQEKLGSPIEPSFMVQGSINLNNDSGDADINYTISGPKGSATVTVSAEKSGGQWNYETMQVTFDDGSGTVDLLE